MLDGCCPTYAAIAHHSSISRAFLPLPSLHAPQGDTFFNVDKREKVKIPRLVRMHSDKMEDIEAVRAAAAVAAAATTE
jgi:translation elongation factor EF-G